MAETTTQSGGRPSLPMQGIPQPSREEVLNLPRVHISTHPVMAHKMTAMRGKNTPPPEFYRLVKEIGALLAYEATASLALEPLPIETPMQPMLGQRLAGGIGVTPILRAGLGLAEAFRASGRPLRNAGALCGSLCLDVPAAADPPPLGEVGLALTRPHAGPSCLPRRGR